MVTKIVGTGGLDQFLILQRQITKAFSGGCEDGVVNSGSHWRHTRLTCAGYERIARHEMHMGLDGRFVQPRDSVVVEVTLLNAPVTGRDLAQ